VKIQWRNENDDLLVDCTIEIGTSLYYTWVCQYLPYT
jgi:hypothetical protein